MGLRADELVSIAGTVNQFLPSRVSIFRAGILLSPVVTMPDGSPLRCRVSPDKETRIEGASREMDERRWKIVLPNQTPILVGDRLHAQNCVYSVVEVANPTSFSVSTTCYAYMLYDASGAYVGIRTNAVVSTTRDGLGLLSLVAVRLVYPDPPHAADTHFGPIVRQTLILADPAQDWQMDDIVTVHTVGDAFAGAPETKIFRVVQATQHADGPPAWHVALDGRQGMEA